MTVLRLLTENFRGQAEVASPYSGRKRAVSLLLGGVIVAAAGTVIVKAADDPGIRQVFIEFNRPIRRAVEPYVPQVRMPEMFRRSAPREVQNQNAAAPRFIPSDRRATGERMTGLPRGALDTLPTEGLTSQPALPATQKQRRQAQGATPGLDTATNYCVRLCDGYAFPVGRAGMGDEGAHEVACRLACPNSPVALFTMPKGAKDFSEARRGNVSYSALPAAFRYQNTYDQACTCRAPGQTQSTAALLSDFTLRRGDLAMTRTGMRHFDGAERFPHRQANFSDALRRISDPKEIKLIRGMEAASLRGNLPVEAHAALRQRIVQEIRQAETVAANPRRTAEAEKPTRRFEEVRALRQYGPQPVRQVEQRQRIVVLN